MDRIAFTLIIPEPKVRKKRPPAEKAHADAKKFSRKAKHKHKLRDSVFENPGSSNCTGVSFLLWHRAESCVLH